LRDLADIFDGPDPSDAPDEHDPFATVWAAIGLLANKLRQEPELSKADANLLIKTVLPEVSIFFQAAIWPQARRIAGLPERGRGRPKKHVLFPEAPRSPLS